MARLSAFVLFTWAAFDWPTPGMDRAGVAALGAAFLAWSVGGVMPSIRGARSAVAPPPTLEHAERISAMSSAFMAAYGATDDNTASANGAVTSASTAGDQFDYRT